MILEHCGVAGGRGSIVSVCVCVCVRVCVASPSHQVKPAGLSISLLELINTGCPALSNAAKKGSKVGTIT